MDVMAIRALSRADEIGSRDHQASLGVARPRARTVAAYESTVAQSRRATSRVPGHRQRHALEHYPGRCARTCECASASSRSRSLRNPETEQAISKQLEQSGTAHGVCQAKHNCNARGASRSNCRVGYTAVRRPQGARDQAFHLEQSPNGDARSGKTWRTLCSLRPGAGRAAGARANTSLCYE